MKKIALVAVSVVLSAVMQAQTATLTVSQDEVHQRITGFGAFVCSPQFGYNHMTDSEISKTWGQGSMIGLNIMRLYLPIGRSAWQQSLRTARQAKQMGLVLFASPWGQPAEWKTNGTVNGKNSDGTTGKLKRENWADYAQYLSDYVDYLRQNGVELDAISIQNEPDWPASYAGCLWSAAEMAEFVATYGSTIPCKIVTPETIGISNGYVNALNKTHILPCFDIYGAHQYGGMQMGFKRLADQGKELWMTEYLINWNSDLATPRDFDWRQDAFDFARSINNCLVNDFNAWIHYSAKRFYGMIGDGTYGTSSGQVTKRGYVMAQFARYLTGTTRIGSRFSDTAETRLEGSAYITDSADSVIVVVINASDQQRMLDVVLPFYTVRGSMVSTMRLRNMVLSNVSPAEPTQQPRVAIPSLSVSTLTFVRADAAGIVSPVSPVRSRVCDLQGRPWPQGRRGIGIVDGKKQVMR